MLAEYLGVNTNGKAHEANGNGRAPTKAKKAADEATLTKGIEPIKTQQIHEGLLAGIARPSRLSRRKESKVWRKLVRWYGEPCIRLDGRAPIDIPNAKQRERRDRVPYATWICQGWITATDGDVIDYDVIRRDIGELGKRFDIREIACDRWNASQQSRNSPATALQSSLSARDSAT